MITVSNCSVCCVSFIALLLRGVGWFWR